MKFDPDVYVSFWGSLWAIFGRMRDAKLLVFDEALVVCSDRMVELYATQAYSSGDEADDDEAMIADLKVQNVERRV